MDKVNIGIIGFGMSGKVFHAPFLHLLPQFYISKISTSNIDSKEYINTTYPYISVVDNANSILDDDTIDLVIVATSNDVHYSLAKEALQKGKHVVVEKPFTITTDEADHLINLAKTENKILTVYQNRRWDSDYKTVKKIIDSGMLGNLVEFVSNFDRFRPQQKENAWREKNIPGSGILYDLGAHLIDQTLQLFGMPQELKATVLSLRSHAQIDDYFDITLIYPKLTARLHSSMLVKSPTPRFELYGDKGSFIKYGLDTQEADLKEGKTPSTSDWGKEPESIWGKLSTDINGLDAIATIESEKGNYVDFYINVYNTIKGNGEILVKPEQARNVIRIIELAKQSQTEKKTIIL